MIFETSLQARFMIPMAISLGFGILFATLIALIIIPCLYLAMVDIKRLLGLESSERPATSLPSPLPTRAATAPSEWTSNLAEA